MAIHRGIQSAIFYYLSCAPCAEARVRKKRKREAMLDRADREALEAEMPNLYRHPSPSSTNPYWGAEIAAGPVLSSRGKRKGGGGGAGGGYGQANESQRRLKTATTERSAGTSADLGSRVASRDGGASVGMLRGNEGTLGMMESAERLPSRSTMVSASSLGSGAGSSASASASGSGITRPPTAMTRDKLPGASYNSFSNPGVNDLLPAIATQVSSREEAAALMLGPPSAEYMAGRLVDSARSRSTSGGSSQLTMRSTGIPLSREVSRRMIERKLLAGGGETMSGLVGSDLTIAGDRPMIEAKDFAQSSSDDSLPLSHHQNRGDYAHQPSEDSARTVLHEPLLAPEPVHRYLTPSRVASRPQLTTILSSDNFENSENTSTTNSSTLLSPESPTLVPKENDLPPFLLHSAATASSDTSMRESTRDKISRRSPILETQQKYDLSPTTTTAAAAAAATTSPPIQVLHGRKPRSPHLDTPVLNTDIFTPSARSGGLDYYSADEGYENDDSAVSVDGGVEESGGGRGTAGGGGGGGGAIFDSWYTPDFALPEWVHEHTKREVSQRWSMDI